MSKIDYKTKIWTNQLEYDKIIGYYILKIEID